MSNIRIKTLTTDKLSTKASQLFSKINLKTILVPESDFDFYTIPTIKNNDIFKKEFSKFTKKKKKNPTSQKIFFVNNKFQSNFRLKNIKNFKSTLNLREKENYLDLNKKIHFLSNHKKNLQNSNEDFHTQKKNFLKLKDRVQKDIKVDFAFLKKKLEKVITMKKELNKSNLEIFQTKKLLLNKFNNEKDKIDDLKLRIEQANALMQKLNNYKDLK
jgi:hypothetical protein